MLPTQTFLYGVIKHLQTDFLKVTDLEFCSDIYTCRVGNTGPNPYVNSSSLRLTVLTGTVKSCKESTVPLQLYDQQHLKHRLLLLISQVLQQFST